MNIGYAVFKNSSEFTINSNGLFEELNLSNIVSSLIENLPSEDINEPIFCFQRLNTRPSKKATKDACLILAFRTLRQNNNRVVLGSAICFKDNQVNEKKIISGVSYLSKQLNEGFDENSEYTPEDLGITLPSPSKDFKMFREEEFNIVQVEKYYKCYDKVSAENLPKYLSEFCNQEKLQEIESLFLASSPQVYSYLQEKKELIRIGETEKVTPAKNTERSNDRKPQGTPENTEINKRSSERKTKENNTERSSESNSDIALLKTKIIELEESKKKTANNYKLLLIIAIIIPLVLFGGYYLKKTDNPNKSNGFYTIEEDLYISVQNYNVNVRETPSTSAAKKATVNDGDLVHLLGYDKNTHWAKIKYGGKETGYIHNRYISKKINTNKIEAINKDAQLTSDYDFIYNSPTDNKSSSNIKTSITPNETVFIKNKIKGTAYFSVRVTKNNKIYNGYLKENTFKYQ